VNAKRGAAKARDSNTCQSLRTGLCDSRDHFEYRQLIVIGRKTLSHDAVLAVAHLLFQNETAKYSFHFNRMPDDTPNPSGSSALNGIQVYR
jgi:hypothetical protein